MYTNALFSGLVFDENEIPVETVAIGGDPFYVVNDAGFHRHIPAMDVDRQIFSFLAEQIHGKEDVVIDQAIKLTGQDDIFARAILKNQLLNIDKQFETLAKTGIPETGRQYLGMMGFRVTINLHGEILKIDQPGQNIPPEDEE
jgi:hypothetical protein